MYFMVRNGLLLVSMFLLSRCVMLGCFRCVSSLCFWLKCLVRIGEFLVVVVSSFSVICWVKLLL